MSLCATFLAGSAQAGDLPTFSSGVRPRMMVIFDNSRSMAQTPTDRYLSDFKQDYSPSEASSCHLLPEEKQSKFCIGKQVMSSVLPEFEAEIELGLASYYQYQQTYESGGGSTECKYDVLEKPGVAYSFSTYFDKGATWASCTPTQLAQCDGDGAGLTARDDKTRTCTRIGTVAASAQTDPAYIRTRYKSAAYSETTAEGTINFVKISSAVDPPTSGLPFMGLSVGQEPHPYETPQDGLLGLGCSAVGSTKDYTGSEIPFYDERQLKPFGCSAANPCTFTKTGSIMYTNLFPKIEFYEDKGASTSCSNGGLFGGLLSALFPCNKVGSAPTIVSDVPGATCQTGGIADSTSAQFGCSADKKCDLTYLDKVGPPPTITTELWYADQGANYVSAGKTFTKTATTPETFSVGTATAAGQLERLRSDASCQGDHDNVADWGCSPTNPCKVKLASSRLAGTAEVPMEFCQYSRTRYTYENSSVSSAMVCRYTRTTYTYQGLLDIDLGRCRWSRQVHKYAAPSYKYEWKTLGGEMVDSYSTMMDPAENLCEGTYHTGFGFKDSSGNAVCPPTISTGVCADTQRQCKLRWRSSRDVGGKIFDKGRNHFYSGSAEDDGRLCRAADWSPSPVTPVIAQPDPANYIAQFCVGTGADITTKTKLVADYYDLGALNPAPLATDAFSPGRMLKKMAGWSRIPTGTAGELGSLTAGTTSMSFVDVGPGKLAAMQAMLRKHDKDTNPTGLRMADEGDYTPLFGSLTNAKEYLQGVINADDHAVCRKYFVMLVTDGQEETPKGYNTAKLKGVVTELLNLTKGSVKVPVRTFVIGFGDGASGGALDEMAVAGGLALKDSSGVGHAYSALDKTQLSQTLTDAFSTVLAGQYTRSKPAFTVDGTRAYVAYFERASEAAFSTEWRGFMDAFNIETSTGNVTGPVWRFNEKIDAQLERKIYTVAPLLVGNELGVGQTLLNLSTDNSAADMNAIYLEMGGTLSEDEKNQVFQFIRNDSKKEPFRDGLHRRSSRLSDIYHSSPVLVAAPPFHPNWAGESEAERAAYRKFKTENAGREASLYVGANDGLLHAVREDANTKPADWAGQERWAYAPPSVLSKLNESWSHHTFSVDGNFASSDVCSHTADCTNAENWRTILVGTLRQGGSSIYALDVTDPTKPVHLWDYTNPALGESWSSPTVARVKVTLPGSGGTQHRWAVFVGGGWSNLPNVANSFYVLDAVTGVAITGKGPGATTETAIFEVEDPAAGKNNVAVRPVVFRKSESSIAEAVFFGDTEGRINKMLLKDKPLVADWKPAKYFDAADLACSKNIAGETVKIVNATTGAPAGALPITSADRMPIYNRVLLTMDANDALYTFVGTGDTTAPTLATGKRDYFYAVKDATAGTCGGAPMWVKQFDADEKVLSESAFSADTVYVGTYKPPPVNLGCGLSGDASLYAFDAATGEPRQVFKDPITNVPTHKITVASKGIMSDLHIVGDRVVFTLSNSPKDIQASEKVPGVKGTQLRGWRRVR
jgi:hypothetical protein